MTAGKPRIAIAKTTTEDLYQHPVSELENISIVASEDLFASEDNELQRLRF